MTYIVIGLHHCFSGTSCTLELYECINKLCHYDAQYFVQYSINTTSLMCRFSHFYKKNIRSKHYIRADLIEIFKMIKGFSAVSWSHFFTRGESGITMGHNWKLMKKGVRSDLQLHSFSHRSVNRWNNLTQEEVDSPSVNSFKNHLEKRRSRKMDFFLD